MNATEFRTELTKIMPGYGWTVQRPHRYKTDTATAPGFPYMLAIGIQTAGFNRMSTLRVERRTDTDGVAVYKVYVSGYGKRTPPSMWAKGGTLVRALRSLQNQCEIQRDDFAACVRAMETGRKGLLS